MASSIVLDLVIGATVLGSATAGFDQVSKLCSGLGGVLSKSAAAESKLVARLCGLNIEDMNRVDYADYLKLQAVLLRFLRGDDDAEA